MKEILNKIAYNVLSALYQPFWTALLIAFLSMFVFLYAKEKNWKKKNIVYNIILTWWKIFKKSQTFRRVFLLSFYTAMILLKTILNREIWIDPLNKLFGGYRRDPESSDEGRSETNGNTNRDSGGNTRNNINTGNKRY